jgi:hypothetical protein
LIKQKIILKYLIVSILGILPVLLKAQVGVKFFKDYGQCTYGVIDTVSGDTLHSPKFIDYQKHGNHFIVNQNGAYGLISSKNGKLLVECKYNALHSRHNNVSIGHYEPKGNWYYFQEGQWWGLLHVKKGEIIPAQLADPRGTLMSKRTNKRQNCYFDTLGTVMCFEKYDYVKHGGDHFILERNGFEFVAGIKGNLIVNDSFDQVKVLENNHFFFIKDSIKGFYSGKGDLLYSTTNSIENLNYRNELVSFYYDNLVIENVEKWGFLNTNDKELKWLLKPEFDTIIKRRIVEPGFTQHLLLATDHEGKFWFADDLRAQVVLEAADQVDYRLFDIEGDTVKSKGYKLYYIKDEQLYEYHSSTQNHELLAKASQFELHGDRLFFKRKKEWYHYYENKIIPLKCQRLYYQTAERTFLYKKVGVQVYNAAEARFLDEYYEEIFYANNQVVAINENGELTRFDGWQKKELTARVQVIAHEIYGAIKYGLFDTLSKSLIFYPVFDSIIIANDKLAYLAKAEERSLYHVPNQQYLVAPGKYPIVELKPNMGWYRYGYDSSSCIHLLDGTQIAKWQNIIYFEEFDENAYFAAADTNAMGLLNKAKPSKWLVKPKYCAISAYDAQSKRASVRACPIERFNQVGYWDEPVDPQHGNWGVTDSTGKWLVEPKSVFPIDLNLENQFIETYNGYEFINLKGEKLWDERYQFIDTFGGLEDVFWVGDYLENRGLRKLNGEFLIENEYNWINEINDTIYALKWPVEMPENGTSYPEEHADGKNVMSKLQVFYFDKNWKPIELSGMARVNFIKDHVNLEWEPHLDLHGVKVKKYTPICAWAVDEYLNSNSVIEDNWSNDSYWASLNYATTLPIYRMPQNVFYRSPRYIDFEYKNMTINGTNYGAYVETEYLGGTIGPGAHQYSSMEFKNVIVEFGEVKELEFWQVIDKKCIYTLNDSLVIKLKKKDLDIDCGKDGLVIYPLMEHFIITNDSLTFLIQNETEYYETTFDRVSIKLDDWPLTAYFLEKRREFGQR